MFWRRKKIAPAALDARTLPWLTGFALLAALPHAVHQPLWVSATFAAAFIWRAGSDLRGWPRPGRWPLLLATLLVTAGVLREFHSLFGRDAGVALLLSLLGLKFLETRTRRDGYVMAVALFVVLGAAFLFDQSLWLGLYATAVVAAGVTALSALAHPAGIMPRERMGLSLRIVVPAAPLMLVLYILFPRIEGGLWALPVSGAGGVTGMSDRMSPGSLESLSLSDRPAFRALFDDSPPTPGERYWRMLVLWQTDGHSWERGPLGSRPMAKAPPAEPLHRYRIVLEASGRNWLPALDYPSMAPEGTRLLAGAILVRHYPVQERLQYSAAAHNHSGETRLSASEKTAALALPPILGERTRTLANELGTLADARARANAVFARFRGENFVYTLNPPRYADDPVEQFLFDGKRGFCEHYASAFVTLMRASGTPARVVIGYLGGEYNDAGRYLLVRDADAHAWAEIWSEGEGWLRMDPTAAIAPERIERGAEAIRRLEAAGLAPGTVSGEVLERVMRSNWFKQALLRSQLHWDLLNLRWYRWVMDYTPDRQLAMLQALGMKTVDALRMVGLMALALALLVMLYAILLSARKHSRTDPAQHAYRRFCHKLARVGLVRGPAEDAGGFAARVSAQRPELAARVRDITEAYQQIRYGAGNRATPGLDLLRRKVRSFRA